MSFWISKCVSGLSELKGSNKRRRKVRIAASPQNRGKRYNTNVMWKRPVVSSAGLHRREPDVCFCLSSLIDPSAFEASRAASSQHPLCPDKHPLLPSRIWEEKNPRLQRQQRRGHAGLRVMTRSPGSENNESTARAWTCHRSRNAAFTSWFMWEVHTRLKFPAVSFHMRPSESWRWTMSRHSTREAWGGPKQRGQRH